MGARAFSHGKKPSRFSSVEDLHWGIFFGFSLALLGS